MNDAFVTFQSPSTAFYFRTNISASSTEFYLGYCVYFRFISFIHIRTKIAHRLQAIVTAEYIQHKDCNFLNRKENSNCFFFVNLIQILIDIGMKISKLYLSLWNVKNEHFSGKPRTIKPKSDVSDIPLRVCFFFTFCWVECIFLSSCVVYLWKCWDDRRAAFVCKSGLKRLAVYYTHKRSHMCDATIWRFYLRSAFCGIFTAAIWFLLDFCLFVIIASLCLDWPSNAICRLMTK